MSLLESPIPVHADRGNGPEPMLMIGADTTAEVDVLYLCVDGAGEIHHLTREWVNVDWRHDGQRWVDTTGSPITSGDGPEPE